MCPSQRTGVAGTLDGFEALEELRGVNLASCPGLRGSMATLAACAKLQDLNVSFCPGISGGRDLDLFKKCRNLATFKAISCATLFDKVCSSAEAFPAPLQQVPRRGSFCSNPFFFFSP